MAEMRRAQHREPSGKAPVEHFARDHRRLDRLADADIVGDQEPHRRLPQRHDQRHELIRTRHDGNVPERAERPRPGTQAQPWRIEQGHDAGRVATAGPRLRGDPGVGELRKPDTFAFERQKQADLIALRDCQRPEPQHFRFALREDDPFPPACMYDGTRPVSAVRELLPSHHSGCARNRLPAAPTICLQLLRRGFRRRAAPQSPKSTMPRCCARFLPLPQGLLDPLEDTGPRPLCALNPFVLILQWRVRLARRMRRDSICVVAVWRRRPLRWRNEVDRAASPG
jgi:hypothetical protein